jgi:hypothetical protein
MTNDVHAINSDSDDEISQMERMIPTEDTVHDGLPNAPIIDLLERTSSTSTKKTEGFTRIYRTALGENVPVSLAHHYMHRDLKLWRFSAYEFTRLFTIRPFSFSS